jgi:hypothetical protein
MDGPGARRTLLDRLSRRGFLQWSLALTISLMLWIAAAGNRTFTVEHSLPVLLPELPAGLTVLLDAGTDSISVSFSGRGIGVLWDQVTRTPSSVRLTYVPPPIASDLPYTVNLSLAQEDVVFDGRAYGRLGATTFNPGVVPLTIDREATRRIPVKVMSAGELPERYYWQRSSSDSVTVTGAASVVLDMDSCRTVGIQPDLGDQTAAILRSPRVAYYEPSAASVALIAPIPVVTFLSGPELDKPY